MPVDKRVGKSSTHNVLPGQTIVNRIAEIARETALIAPDLLKDLAKPNNKKMERISPQPQLATSKKIEKVQHKTVKPAYIENKTAPKSAESKPKVVKPRPKVLPAITNNITDTIPVSYRHAQNNRVLAPRPVNNLVYRRQPTRNQIKIDQKDPQIELAKSVKAVTPFVVAEQFDIMPPLVTQTETETLPVVDVEEYRTEQITPAEALIVYSEILALVENQENILITSDIVGDNGKTSNFTLEDLETVEDLIKISEAVKPLQTLIDQYPQPDEQIKLDEIKDNINEQTLGETIVQLALYFSQNIEEKQDKDELTEIRAEIEAVEIKTILKEIVVELEKSAEDAGEAKITPEITHMLLTLLQTLGYENPRETLLKFVAQNNVDVLLQSITHLHFLSDDSYQEFKKGTAQSLIFSGPANSSTITYIGKMLLEFITPFAYQKI